MELTWTSLLSAPHGTQALHCRVLTPFLQVPICPLCMGVFSKGWPIFREPGPGGVIFGKLRSFWSRLCTLNNNCHGIIFLVILCPQPRPLLIGLCHGSSSREVVLIILTIAMIKHFTKANIRKRAGTSGGHTTSEVWKQRETNAGLSWLGP